MPKFGELNVATIREFDGGWNTVTSDLNLASRFSKVEENMYFGLSGNKQKRYGTELFTSAYNSETITEEYASVPIISTRELIIPQDTIHEYDVDDVIVVESPADLAGEYTILANNYINFVVQNTKTGLSSKYTEVSYYKKDLPASRLAATVEVNDTTLVFTRFTNKKCKEGETINIISSLDFLGTYTIKRSTGTEFVIDIPVNGYQVPTQLLYEYSGDANDQQISSRYAETPTEYQHHQLKFEFGDAHRRLLAGHQLLCNNKFYYVKESTDTYYLVDYDSAIGPTGIPDLGVTTIRNFTGSIHDKIINITYFVDKLVGVSGSGEVFTVDSQGNVTIIFNDRIAKTVNNNEELSGFGPTDHVCFAVFNGILTIWNGRNKPLAVDFTNNVPCNFLVDEALQTNSNIPVAKYAIAMNHYLVVGNILDNDGTLRGDRIMISDYDAIGTFNDGTESTLENGGITVDLGKICSANISEIRGLYRYRTQLIVSFDEVSVFGELGHMEDAVTPDGTEYKVHAPEFSDTIANYGSISNRTFQNILGDVCTLSYKGLGLFKKASISGMVFPLSLSTIIGPELYKSFKDLSPKTMNDRIWSVYNQKEQQYMLFVPNHDEESKTTETKCFVFTIPSVSGAKSSGGCWSLFTGWNFQCGCVSALGEVFLAYGGKIYRLGNIDRPIFRDFAGDPAYPVEESTGLDGKDIEFAWEFGWQDMNNRHAVKTLRYVGVSATGTSPFCIGTWYDYIQDDECEQFIEFVGGDANGWGAGRQQYGGGRRVDTEKLFAYTAKFNLIKLKIYGKSKEDLKINSISLHYLTGNLRR